MKNVLISGASIAGLSTAWWMSHLGYQVTVVELAAAPRTAGGAVDIRDQVVETVKRMGIYDALKAASLHVERMEFKYPDDTTAWSMVMPEETDGIEIERDQFVDIMLSRLQQVTFLFNNSITAIQDSLVTFKDGQQGSFDLILGCDGIHSTVRTLIFGPEAEYSQFLNAYFSISIVPKLLVPEKTMQAYNEPDKAVMLNAYNGKTDIIFCYYAEQELDYNYRKDQRHRIIEQFQTVGWRSAELLQEIQASDNFYFDKFCQIHMPCWTQGRVALIGDAGYCASPAAGMGASLSIAGAEALADALLAHGYDHEKAFETYNANLRSFVEQVQATARRNIQENFILRTEEAIRQRNQEGFGF
ncbi:FAD-dependent monooxygenase [Mucilaginibacter segetis]|uniref:FAD-dependent monooxygenase n=1 Tax=Mucilaginibacter segetis TaxID=2793071 RepID=A0A934UMR5_9SPHI|nr:FAD-dependent monooxygenase [Mucilaginibacter segetis]MBK0379300.1 FAD-dependent monooxygenase [Mucilaginibacter segetis]